MLNSTWYRDKTEQQVYKLWKAMSEAHRKSKEYQLSAKIYLYCLWPLNLLLKPERDTKQSFEVKYMILVSNSEKLINTKEITNCLECSLITYSQNTIRLYTKELKWTTIINMKFIMVGWLLLGMNLNIIKMWNIKTNSVRMWNWTAVFNCWVHTDNKQYHTV